MLHPHDQTIMTIKCMIEKSEGSCKLQQSEPGTTMIRRHVYDEIIKIEEV